VPGALFAAIKKPLDERLQVADEPTIFWWVLFFVV